MDGATRNRGDCAKQDPGAQQKMMENDSNKRDNVPERVTLKKEIGLLSACAIIIGEVLTASIEKKNACLVMAVKSYFSFSKNLFYSAWPVALLKWDRQKWNKCEKL